MRNKRQIKKHISADINSKLLAEHTHSNNSKCNEQEPDHSPQVLLDQLPEAIKQQAINWYKCGIQRGLRTATDLMLEDHIFKENGVLHAPTSIDFNLKTRHGNENWEYLQFKIQAEDIGFEH